MRNYVSNIKSFLRNEAFCGLLLCLCASFAILLVNSRFQYIHQYIFDKNFFNTNISGHFLVNDVLMSFFFLQVGIELRHELKYGALAKTKHALLPLIAAFGGVLVPALIYISFNHNEPLIKGWAIPTATDIAFAIGIYSILHSRFPRNLRIILLSIAIIDDILAILIIALFYSNTINLLPLLCSFIITIIFYFINKKFAHKFVLCAAFFALWLSFFKAGIHPTLSGVIIGLLTKQKTPFIHNHGFLHFLNLIVSFAIMPIFSFANANISFNAINLANYENIRLIFGIMAALIIGKPLGIFSTGFFGIKLRFCHLPQSVNLKHFLFISLLSGIGFTMALFTILLSFTSNNSIQSAKIGVTFGSFIAAIIGLLYGYFSTKRNKNYAQTK